MENDKEFIRWKENFLDTILFQIKSNKKDDQERKVSSNEVRSVLLLQNNMRVSYLFNNY